MNIADADIAFVSPTGVLRVNENTVNSGGEGGRVSIVADNSEDDTLSESMRIMGVTVLLNYRKNSPMFDWPAMQATMDEERYTLVLVRVPKDKQARTIKAAEREKAAVAARAEEAKMRTAAKKAEAAPLT